MISSMGKQKTVSCYFLLAILLSNVGIFFAITESLTEFISAVGDPGMTRDGLRVAIESWNQCNEVGEEAPNMGSPRAADCFDIYKASSSSRGQNCNLGNKVPYLVVHRVTDSDNKLGVGTPFLNMSENAVSDVDLYAAEKELYLGYKCQVEDKPNPWQFWMIMLKNGNMDTYVGKCPENGHKKGSFGPDNNFPCFGRGCMNQPFIYHDYTIIQRCGQSSGKSRSSTQGGTLQCSDRHADTSLCNRILNGRFYGSWDLEAGMAETERSLSYFSVSWEKEIGKGSWVFHHVLRTSKKYPWLMLYFRSDATKGLSGGYHYPTRGMSKIIPESPNFKVKFSLKVTKGGGNNSQFYLMDIGSCWKNNGKPCDGNVTSDITRYSEMIINPSTSAWCNPENLKLCPPYHTFSNGTRIHRNDTVRFPYNAYHLYCSPGNSLFLEEPFVLCDPYSNPQAQEILQILPHPVWGEYGYPIRQGEGWIGDERYWELDVGKLSHLLYFYQDPETPPARRQWMSVDIGTEIYKDPDQLAEWFISDFDILVPKSMFE